MVPRNRNEKTGAKKIRVIVGGTKSDRAEEMMTSSRPFLLKTLAKDLPLECTSIQINKMGGVCWAGLEMSEKLNRKGRRS